MQAIEFETILQQGSLKILASCSNWEGQLVKVIILHSEAEEAISIPLKTNVGLAKLAGIAQGAGESIAEKHDTYLDYLLVKQNIDEKPPKRIPKFGCAKGIFKMSDDFDEPLENFANNSW